jgi:hypothetical protein
MAVTAQEVITSARDLHMAFTEQRNPNALLLRQLAKYKRTLTHDVTNVNSSVLAVEEVVDITTFDFDLGYAFPAHVYVLPDGEVEPANEIDTGDRSKFWIIGQNVRRFSRPLRSGWFVQDQLFLNGSARDWNGAVNLHIHYVAIPTGPTALADDFDPFPDTVLDTLIAFTANVMAKRGHNDQSIPEINTQQFQADFDAAEARFLMEQGEKKKARRIKTIDVFPGG